jgi:hypothetical protein
MKTTFSMRPIMESFLGGDYTRPPLCPNGHLPQIQYGNLGCGLGGETRGTFCIDIIGQIASIGFFIFRGTHGTQTDSVLTT